MPPGPAGGGATGWRDAAGCRRCDGRQGHRTRRAPEPRLAREPSRAGETGRDRAAEREQAGAGARRDGAGVVDLAAHADAPLRRLPHELGRPHDAVPELRADRRPPGVGMLLDQRAQPRVEALRASAVAGEHGGPVRGLDLDHLVGVRRLAQRARDLLRLRLHRLQLRREDGCRRPGVVGDTPGASAVRSAGPARFRRPRRAPLWRRRSARRPPTASPCPPPRRRRCGSAGRRRRGASCRRTGR